jgi:hypothetical protein
MVYSLVGVSENGRKTTLCVNLESEAEAKRIATSLVHLGDYPQIDVVADFARVPSIVPRFAASPNSAVPVPRGPRPRTIKD